MKTLIVGAGALGGLIAARLMSTGIAVALATRDSASAQEISRSGLKVTGLGGDITTEACEVAALDEYPLSRKFDLVVLATKAQAAIDVAPILLKLLAPGGTLLPIQNGGVPQMLASQLGEEFVLGGLSNLGATMVKPGVYEQRNAGHLLIGELRGGESNRTTRVQQWLGQSVTVKITANLRGAVWSKLLLNCSVTTLGAIAGRTMREYIGVPDGRALFDRTYDETLAIALASGNRPERMLVDPIPPERGEGDKGNHAYEAWLEELLKGYGDLKASMLQDFERGRTTEIDFINGYVVDLGRQLKIATPVNTAIVDMVRAITRRARTPDLSLLRRIHQSSLEDELISCQTHH
jgi:2-dehydropantoate 2-reductase